MAVGVGAAVGVGVFVGAGVFVGTGAGVTTGVGVADGLGAGDADELAEGVGAALALGVGTGVGAGVGAAVGAGVGASVGAGVGDVCGTAGIGESATAAPRAIPPTSTPAISPATIAVLPLIARERISDTGGAAQSPQVSYDPNPMGIVHSLFARLVTALVTVLGAAIVTAGLLSYGDPTAARVVAEVPPSATPTESAAPSGAGPTASPTLTPNASASPTARPGKVVATRVLIPALQIDLPIVAPPSGYPLCNVAMWFADAHLGQPGQGKATYLFAHARAGMFGPIYEAVIIRRAPKSLLGLIVQVYTSDNKLYLYEITKVLPHQTSLDAAFNAKNEQLWLQTSEGPAGTVGKTQVLAMPLSVSNADPAEAHPVAKPVTCG